MYCYVNLVIGPTRRVASRRVASHLSVGLQAYSIVNITSRSSTAKSQIITDLENAVTFSEAQETHLFNVHFGILSAVRLPTAW